jgi:endonuclease YncB( thermonuclease family)
MKRILHSTQQSGTKCLLPQPLWTKTVLWSLLLVPLLSALSKTTDVRVVQVVDGNTVVATDAQSLNSEARLHAVDAPECGMPFGPQVQAFLEELILGRTVKMESKGRDRYPRTVATLAVAVLDLGLAMLEAALSWHDQGYNGLRLAGSGGHHAEARQRSTLNLAGLWAEPQRVAPWLWGTGNYQP